MSELYEKSIAKLELDQILRKLADCAGSPEGKKACLSLCPSADIDDVRLLQKQTTAASELSTRKGYPGFLAHWTSANILTEHIEADVFITKNFWKSLVCYAVRVQSRVIQKGRIFPIPLCLYSLHLYPTNS